MYKQRRAFQVILTAVFLAASLTGCACSSNMAEPAASASRTPIRYEEDPLAFLKQRVGESAPEESLTDKEKEQLTAMADLAVRMDLCMRTEDLDKRDTLFPLYIYYQDTFFFDEITSSYLVEEDNIPYAPETGLDIASDFFKVIPAENAEAFIRDALGKEIPQKDEEYGVWDDLFDNDIVFRDGKYYIRQGDYEALYFRLRAYQPLGDGIYYVSFDGDDSYMAGPPEANKGNMPDYYRLLVARSDSAFGFTILAKLKAGDNSLLPAGFPLPLYAA